MTTNTSEHFSPAVTNAGTAYFGFLQLRSLFAAIQKLAPQEGDIHQLAQIGALAAAEFLALAKVSLATELTRPAPNPKTQRPKRQRPKAVVVPIAPDTKH